MNAKRFLRGPVLWILLALFLVLLGTSLWSSFGAPKDVETSQIIQTIQSNQAQSAKLIDREQKIEVTGKDGTVTTA